MERQYRQGDVLLCEVEVLPHDSIIQPEENGRVILAFGEATGHAHAIEQGLAHIYRKGRDEYLVAKSGAVLRHEEHAPIKIVPGTYRIVRQREWSDTEIRRVLD